MKVSELMIVAEVRDDVLGRVGGLAPGVTEVDVRNGEVDLAGELETKADAEVLEKLVAKVPGVVSVRSASRSARRERLSAAEEGGVMSIYKSHRYGVRTEWHDGKRVTASAPGKPVLDVALPSDFKNGVPSVWSPEELLIASVATCFELTMIAVAEYKDVPLHDVRVDATGHVERKGHLYKLILLELDVHAATDSGRGHDIEQIAEMAHEGCLVGNALDVPVRLDVAIHEATLAEAPA